MLIAYFALKTHAKIKQMKLRMQNCSSWSISHSWQCMLKWCQFFFPTLLGLGLAPTAAYAKRHGSLAANRSIYAPRVGQNVRHSLGKSSDRRGRIHFYNFAHIFNTVVFCTFKHFLYISIISIHAYAFSYMFINLVWLQELEITATTGNWPVAWRSKHSTNMAPAQGQLGLQMGPSWFKLGASWAFTVLSRVGVRPTATILHAQFHLFDVCLGFQSKIFHQTIPLLEGVSIK